MTTEIITATIAASGAIVLAGASYWFTKQRERAAELRKEKLEHYKDFVASMSGVTTGETTIEGQRAFALACNKLNLIAPQAVLRALQAFQQEIKIINNKRSQETHDKLMSSVFLETRRDLGTATRDEDTEFLFGFWAPGA